MVKPRRVRIRKIRKLAFRVGLFSPVIFLTFVGSTGAVGSRLQLAPRLELAKKLGIATTPQEADKVATRGSPTVDRFVKHLSNDLEPVNRLDYGDAKNREYARIANGIAPAIHALRGKAASCWYDDEGSAKSLVQVRSIAKGLCLPNYPHSQPPAIRATAAAIVASWCVQQSIRMDILAAAGIVKLLGTPLQELMDSNVTRPEKVRQLTKLIQLLPDQIDFAQVLSQECGRFTAPSIKEGFDLVIVDGVDGEIKLSTWQKFSGIWFDSTSGSFRERCGDTAWLTSFGREALLSDYLASEIAYSSEILEARSNVSKADNASLRYAAQLDQTNWLMKDLAEAFLKDNIRTETDYWKNYLTRRNLLRVLLRELQGSSPTKGDDFDLDTTNQPFKVCKSRIGILIYSVGANKTDDGGIYDPKNQKDDTSFRIRLN